MVRSDLIHRCTSKTLRRLVGKLTKFAVGIYLLVCIIMWFLENRLVYPRQTAEDFWQKPPSAEIEEVRFPTTSGDHVHGWYLPCPESGTTVLICHGNGGNLSYRGETLLRMRDQLRTSVLIFDYPGYGKTPGKPSEDGCYSTGHAAVNWLMESKGLASEAIILFGESLGGGVAVELARSRKFKLLLLVKTFTTLPAAAKNRYRWLPVHTLMRNRFDNLSKIGDCQVPIFIASATADRVVPFAHGEALTQAARSPVRFFPLEGQDHNDRLPDEFYDAVRDFLRDQP